MARILGVGIATLDLLFEVDHFPREDEEMRAQNFRVARGGNATNTLVMLAQRGHQCDWAGVLADAAQSALIRDDLARYAIDTTHSVLRPGKPPTSSILLTPSGSRSIVHYRDLPEFAFSDFVNIDLAPYAWLHFEARNILDLEQMLRHARAQRPDLKISLEAEKPRPGLDRLLGLADVVLASQALAEQRGFDQAQVFLQALRKLAPSTLLFAAWGAQGAYALDLQDTLHHSPAFPPQRIVDSVGAGDAFNAGVIDALLCGLSAPEALEHACRLAGQKCGVHGFQL